jgi:hypothetical protein
MRLVVCSNSTQDAGRETADTWLDTLRNPGDLR